MNAAFDAALAAGGAVDTAVGVPKAREEMFEFSNPNEGLEAVRKIERYAAEWDIKCVGTFPAGLSYDRIFTELPDVPFRDHVWPKFLRENAARVFKLDA